MRIRTIKPEFWRDPDSTGRWSADLKLFYIGMWMVADDDGRFAWEPDLIAADLFPFERGANVKALLEKLVQGGQVVRYEHGGRSYGWLRNFAKHQKINRPTPSRLPPPPLVNESSVSPPASLAAGKDQGSGKGSGIREHEGAEAVAPAPPPPASPVVLTLKCSGVGPKVYDVTQAQVDEWIVAYPGVDVLAEIRKSAAWQDAQPKRRKTHKGMAAHLVSWFGRAQDGGRSRKAAVGGALPPGKFSDYTGPVDFATGEPLRAETK